MSVITDIQAVLTDPQLTRDEKRAQVRAIRTQACVDQAQARLPWTIGQITVTSIAYDASTNTLTVDGTGGPPLLWPVRITNPPTFVEDPQGPFTSGEGEAAKNYRLDPVAALRAALVAARAAHNGN